MRKLQITGLTISILLMLISVIVGLFMVINFELAVTYVIIFGLDVAMFYVFMRKGD
ncbi:hypothetical protein NE282_03180 [Leuconostoc mesenteroides]|uniref:hypothetical protein n=1 Tax=Leuconostoc mesenteroides TaxID=1245 RepID=UPI00207327FE|nr:hypothetical protein [Leuconostoc mesenteroides]MCM6832922.1 hypothetical protein [Leuconostoc mesenteroides]